MNLTDIDDKIINKANQVPAHISLLPALPVRWDYPYPNNGS